MAAENQIRRAGPDDSWALVRMRALMMNAMGRGDDDPAAPWRYAAQRWFAAQLDRPDAFAAFVVDDPELGVVSCAVGICDRHAPGPTNLSGLHGHVSNVSTHPDRRRLGHARRCLEALLDWFRDETEARVVNLSATAHGLELYRSLGFVEPRYPSLQLRTVDASRN